MRLPRVNISMPSAIVLAALIFGAVYLFTHRYEIVPGVGNRALWVYRIDHFTGRISLCLGVGKKCTKIAEVEAPTPKPIAQTKRTPEAPTSKLKAGNKRTPEGPTPKLTTEEIMREIRRIADTPSERLKGQTPSERLDEILRMTPR